MRKVIVLMSASALLLGCSSRTITVTSPPSRSGTVVVVPEKDKSEKASDRSEKGNGKAKSKARGPRKLNGVPPGHYPPKGMCRVWYEGRPPGQQPKPVACSKLRGRVPSNAFVLYNGKYWDAQYDWSAERRSLPEVIADILLDR